MKRVSVGVAGAMTALAALAGCSALDDTSQPTEAQERLAESKQETDGSSPVFSVSEGDTVIVPAVEEWGQATVEKIYGQDGSVSRLVVDFESVPIDEFEFVDRAENARACTVVTPPEVDGINEGVRAVTISFPNGAGAAFNEELDGSVTADLFCVGGDPSETAHFQKLDQAKEQAFASGTASYRATVRLDEVVIDD